MGTPAVPPPPLSHFSLFQLDHDSADALLQVASDDFDLTSLDKVALNEQSLSYVYPSLQGEVMMPAMDVVIVGVRTTRSYWQSAFQPGQSNDPPDCSSDTGQIGVGHPGGVCVQCPMNQFGSDPQSLRNGKACREYRELFVMDQDDVFPKLLRVPRTTLASVSRYLFALAKRKLTEQMGEEIVHRPMTPTDVLTRLTLIKGKRFLEVTCQTVQVLRPEEREMAHYYAEAFTRILTTPVAQRDPTPEAEAGDIPF
jgi:hypothetical protein